MSNIDNANLQKIVDNISTIAKDIENSVNDIAGNTGNMAAKAIETLSSNLNRNSVDCMDFSGQNNISLIEDNELSSYLPCEIGQAAKIKTESDRIDWLYDGNGVPQTEEENNKYLETFSINYIDSEGNLKTKDITMHTKLKEEVQSLFNELVNNNFPINWEGAGAIRGWNEGNPTDVSSNTFSKSAHCYGYAVDINVMSNPYIKNGVGDSTAYRPGDDPYSITPQIAEIFTKHGFYWGGDWNDPVDYMHFSYFDH